LKQDSKAQVDKRLPSIHILNSHKEKEMLDFRKLFLAAAILALMSVSAFAQLSPLSCVAQAAGTPSIRAEGVAELVGDVLILCNGGTPKSGDQNLDQVNIQVFASPSINITSRYLDTSGIGVFNFSEALLFIDEPTPDDQTICGGTVYPYSVPAFSNQQIIGGVCGLHSGTTGPVLGIGTYDPDTPAGTITQIVGLTTNTSASQRGNTYQARQSGSNSLIWQGIPFDPPGTQTTRIIRLTNIRVNASQLGVPAGAQASVSLVVSTSASGVGNPIALPITNPAPTVAIAQNSLNFSVRDTKNCLQCESANNRSNSTFDGTNLQSTLTCDSQFVELRYEELFPSVFRRRNQANPGTGGVVPPTPIDQNVLGFIYQTETGFFRANTSPVAGRWPTQTSGQGNESLIAGTAGGTLGLADHGTRLIARFSNVQNGVAIWARGQAAVVTPQGGGGTTGQAVLVNTDPNGAGPFSATNLGGAYGQISIVGGTGQAVWEIVNADTTAIERVEVQIVFAWLSNTSNNLPALGTSSANGNLAPISTTATASSTAALPRFVDGAVNRTLMTINSCRSNILFPFVTNIAGFDTGLAIANTTKDPFGTALQTGNCTVNFYGTVGTSKVCLSYPSPSITGGEYFAWSLSSGGPVQATAGFTGYVIAQCNFQYGHGFAFISDPGASKFIAGYVALIMDESIGTRTGSKSETLGH
jgi:hypothetical protein